MSHLYIVFLIFFELQSQSFVKSSHLNIQFKQNCMTSVKLQNLFLYTLKYFRGCHFFCSGPQETAVRYRVSQVYIDWFVAEVISELLCLNFTIFWISENIEWLQMQLWLMLLFSKNVKIYSFLFGLYKFPSPFLSQLINKNVKVSIFRFV